MPALPLAYEMPIGRCGRRSTLLVDKAGERNHPGGQHNKQYADALQIRANMRVVGSYILAFGSAWRTATRKSSAAGSRKATFATVAFGHFDLPI